MSAEIIQFIPRPNRSRRRSEFPVVTRSVFRTDDLTMDHADTAPCEWVLSGDEPGEKGEPR